MKKLLHIGTSVRPYHPEETEHQSISRMLAMTFIEQFRESYKQTEVIQRDLSVTPPAYIDQRFVAASFAKGELSPEEQTVLAESDRLIAEVVSADIILISSPMYNYGMPAALKAWFDQIIRIDKTFSFDLARGDNPLRPILKGKQLVLLASWGEFNFLKGQSKYEFNHLSSHIEQLAPYLGAEQFYEIASEYQEFGDQRHEQSKARAIANAKTLARDLALV